MSFNLRDGISTQGLKIVIFSGAYITFPFDTFGPGVKVRTNPRDDGFPTRLKLHISSVKLVSFAGSGVKTSLKLRYSISTQGPKIVIFSGSCSTFLFDSFRPGMEIRMNPCDGGFPKRPKLYISSVKLVSFAGFGWSENKL